MSLKVTALVGGGEWRIDSTEHTGKSSYESIVKRVVIEQAAEVRLVVVEGEVFLVGPCERENRICSFFRGGGAPEGEAWILS